MATEPDGQTTNTPIGAGETVSTDHSGNGAGGFAPVETMITSPNAGFVTVEPTGQPFSTSGFSFLGETVVISAPDATPENPLVIEFEVDPTQVIVPGEVQVFRDGVLVPECTNPNSGVANPDPCVDGRFTNPVTGFPQVVVLTSQASDWNLAVRTPTCKGQEATIFGDDGDNVLVGTSGDDVIWAGAGNDIVRGLGGDDLICLGAGDDTGIGGSGNDTIYGGRNADTINGGKGRDRLFGKAGADILDGGGGGDRLVGGRGPDQITGGFGSDSLKGGGGDDTGVGGPGTDRCLTVEFASLCEI